MRSKARPSFSRTRIDRALSGFVIAATRRAGRRVSCPKRSDGRGGLEGVAPAPVAAAGRR